MLKLYDNAFAPSPRRVRMFLAEKGLVFETAPVDIAAGETASADFLAVNPLGELPVLELEDGTRLRESLAICRYLEAMQPEPALLGRDDRERAEIESIVLQLMFRVYVPTTHAFRHTHKFWARQSVLSEWQRLDGDLSSREFLAGDRFSFADIVGYTTLEFGKPSGIRLQEDQANLRRWHAAIAARPSAKA
jgi:glutathione S-transferase